MDEQFNPSFERLQRRLVLMQELANSLQQVQSAVVGLDLSAINDHTLHQRELCDALRQIESEAPGMQSSSGGTLRKRNHWAQLPQGAVAAEVRERWQTLSEELIQLELRVSQLNRVYGALLRRAQRTLQIFMRVLASSANTYTPPKGASIMAPATAREVSHV
jgi:flagellar FlgN protein